MDDKTPSWMYFVNKVSEIIAKTINAIVTTMMGLLTIIVVINVFMRYVFSLSFPWSEEFARYSMVWIVFLGSSLAIKNNEHVAVDFLVNLFPCKIKRIISLCVRLLIFVFLYFLIVRGIETAQITSNQISSALHVSNFWVYLAAPIGGVLMFFYTLTNILNDFFNSENS